MYLHVLVDACIVCLVDHAELNFLRRRGDYKVEGIAQNGCICYRIYGGKVEEGKGFFEAPDYAFGCEK